MSASTKRVSARAEICDFFDGRRAGARHRHGRKAQTKGRRRRHRPVPAFINAVGGTPRPVPGEESRLHLQEASGWIAGLFQPLDHQHSRRGT